MLDGEHFWKDSMARSLIEEMPQQIDPVEALEPGAHLSATAGIPARNLAART